MKKIPIIFITAFVIYFFESCSSTTNVVGKYTHVIFGVSGGEDIRFTEKPNEFKYFSRVEGSVKSYSTGTWLQDKKIIFLNGFNDKNIDILNIESRVEDNLNEGNDKIVVQYKDDPLEPFTKVDIIINEVSKIRISGDTTLVNSMPIKTVQIKSYLEYEGFGFRAPPQIDTLYSPKLEISRINRNKIISLKFNISMYEFYRVKLNDTLYIRNKHSLKWRNMELKKVKNN